MANSGAHDETFMLPRHSGPAPSAPGPPPPPMAPAAPPAPAAPAAPGRRLTFEEVRKLVNENNKSQNFSNEAIICLIWKESGFKPDTRNPRSTATGLMQMTNGAVEDVNRNSPGRFSHEEMTDPAKNIQTGTLYLDIRVSRAGSSQVGMDRFGTGAGYSKNILECETCLKQQIASKNPKFEGCLHKFNL
jgi:hypothetical protein